MLYWRVGTLSPSGRSLKPQNLDNFLLGATCVAPIQNSTTQARRSAMKDISSNHLSSPISMMTKQCGATVAGSRKRTRSRLVVDRERHSETTTTIGRRSSVKRRTKVSTPNGPSSLSFLDTCYCFGRVPFKI